MQFYLSQVFGPHAMLREQTRPVLPVSADLQAADLGRVSDSHLATRADSRNRTRALLDDARIPPVEHDAEPEYPSRMFGDEAVAEIKPEEVGITTRGEFHVVAKGAV